MKEINLYTEDLAVVPDQFYEQKSYICVTKIEDEPKQITLIELSPMKDQSKISLEISQPVIRMLRVSLEPTPDFPISLQKSVRLLVDTLQDAMKIASDVYSKVIEELQSQATRIKLLQPGGPRI